MIIFDISGNTAPIKLDFLSAIRTIAKKKLSDGLIFTNR